MPSASRIMELLLAITATSFDSIEGANTRGSSHSQLQKEKAQMYQKKKFLKDDETVGLCII